jgi:hypothetical protein
MTTHDNSFMDMAETGSIRKPLEIKGVEADGGRMRPDDGSAPYRTRTYNPLIKSCFRSNATNVQDCLFTSISGPF